MYTKESILTDVVQNNIELIDLQFTDILGVTKSVTVPARHLADIFERGCWFDGSSIYGFARVEEGDMLLMPDARTYRVLPWVETPPRRARIICDVLNADGQPFAGDPRYALKRVLAKAEKMGFPKYNIGPELEFFLFRKQQNGDSFQAVPHDVGGYFDFSPMDEAERVRSEITIMLQKLEIDVEFNHHEVAIGQHEIDFRYSDALHSADNAITFKYTVKGVAVKHGLFATFMPKPIFGQNGSGMHCHQSLFNDQGNQFYDTNDEYKLSKTAYQFMAGLLHHARGMSAVVAPTVNSYKRLTPGYEAPVYICWAQRNRSALIRVPRYSPGREQSTRMELRFPDPSSNPYLAFAVMLAAGLDGIEKKMEAPAPINEDLYAWSDEKRAERGVGVLPGSLKEALEDLSKDEVIREALGSHIYDAYVRAKQAEWEGYRLNVTDWELKRYLETT
ncbi:MAG: type I glutamate--ammonia ligase [Anaerolineae bacterium]|jgi:glutamine synthetase|nr:type I glutamate--ammonia ligase [Anaerolineae bacterium]